MAAAASANPLISGQKSSQLQTVLHPLVLLAISDYITRHTLREQQGPIIGALLGQQNGREITIEHVFECHTRSAPEVEGGYLLDAPKFGARLEQMVTVHKERRLELVGWYTLLPVSGPTLSILPIHSQIVEGWNESAILLGFHPEEALNHSVGGKLPLTIYESSYEVDDIKNDQDGEDKKMDDGEPALRLKFREVPYSVETDETEMISMNYVAGGGGGKRRLVESGIEETKRQAQQDADDVLTREEEEIVASLTAKANAIKMLHSRIRLLATYLERLPPSFVNGEHSDADRMETDNTVPSMTILRQIQALVGRLDLVIPSDKEAFDRETLQQSNDVHLFELLNTVMQNLSQARDVGKKSSIVESSKLNTRRPTADAFPGGSPYSLAGSGDIFI
ncbi:maintenance of mitochondrial structure and function [Hirsutella rhossiliensis]|uniref:COP9 signalosome complex subunit 6 n=1 Tax=Hirsutella rhossiliensis TaxID=111463 RepID=A0A9P8N258_9HYPO|nr:maintenance of mitochondrial structure and function [Hirsutella rhossiliensis]KAH0965505.1 maintenance of mitochondrial structure and function [Hirsutella rhossiliensis]